MTLGIKFTGPVYDASGYAEFGRQFLSATYRHPELDITLEPISFEQARPDIGEHAKALQKLLNRKIPYTLKVVNAVPNIMRHVVEKDVKNVCFTMFETTKIPDDWTADLNKYCDAVFVPCQWNKEVFQNSGVTKPIYVVQPGIDRHIYEDIDRKSTVSELANLSPNTVSFYSIFQFTERKNPEGLLVAYLSEFDGVDDVCLVLKTYGHDFSPEQQTRVRNLIIRIKDSIKLKKPPKILLLGQLMSNNQIIDLHRSCDCFVLPHRAEGFGMPHLEAMAAGKPVITTGFSGNMDFMNKDNSYLLDYQMTVVANMTHSPHYEANMEWAEPNVSQLKRYMREVYTQIRAHKLNHAGSFECAMKAMTGQKHVLENFNLEKSAEAFVAACKKVANV